MLPTISGYIGSIYNYQDFLNNVINRINQTTLSSSIYYYNPIITTSGYLTQSISSYISYIPPSLSTYNKFIINKNVLISGNLECSSLYNYIDNNINTR